ncbi:MAG: class II aldolase/adducin family protein [Beijerinckiaceae bacterium]|nr:class II aldolase/adducin family protein [Beijerinckiaceae bacterium]MDO9441007.1 class II aldolase/adducin family protein [Beijerinckiaceae bacterium]
MRLFRCACHSGLSYWSNVARAPADVGGGTRALPRSGGPVDASVLHDLAAASRILADQGVVDAFGHVSMRHPSDPNRFLMSRSLAPALVTPDDIMEYDLDCDCVDAQGRGSFLERFIHGEIFRKRPDVMAVVHSHSPNVIPFGLIDTPMRAMFHNAAFVARGVPVFDIHEKFGATDMLVGNSEKGVALAEKLGDKDVMLMRAHGSVATGPSLPVAVFRAVYTEVNARLQFQTAMLAGGGNIAALDAEEGRLADEVNLKSSARAWDLWKRRVGF